MHKIGSTEHIATPPEVDQCARLQIVFVYLLAYSLKTRLKERSDGTN